MRGAWGSRWCFILKRLHLDGCRGQDTRALAAQNTPGRPCQLRFAGAGWGWFTTASETGSNKANVDRADEG
jgi:hypothetical protein